jgi:hypothetical protein
MLFSSRLIDEYLPVFDVSDYRETRVRADPDRAYAALRSLDINRSRIVRMLFAIRALPARLRGEVPAPVPPAKSLLDQTLEIGWRILEERPGREIVVGAVTRPWKAVVRFRGLAPRDFIDFEEPGFTKIAWSNRVDASEPGFSTLSLETRVLATDPVSRRRFRRYWLAVGLGIRLIRIEALRLVKRDLERGRPDLETKRALTSRA